MRTGLIVGIGVLAASVAQAQPAAPGSGNPLPRRAIHAVRLPDQDVIVLDGRLDEQGWSRAVPAGNFMQQDPANGQPATEQTEVRILYNKDTLYMGVVCFDSEPEKWLGYQRRRDEFLQADDRFMWNIDTYNNQQSGYFFETNPSGLLGDSLRGATFQNRQWDGIWNATVLRSEVGWTIEVEIPFRTLNFDPNADAWGINFQRTVRRKNEESLWMGWARNQGLNRLTNSGLLTGLQGITQGHGLDVKPYLLGTSEAFPGRGSARTKNHANAGVDLFYSPVPRIRTNLTINTDFAQTEVDQRLVNLTRFPQFFPEKRDFFLDGSTFFDFQSTAQGGNSLLPYFSRRIGLDANGNPQKIDVGAKLAGQFGTNDVGALYVRTGREAAAPGEDFAALRAKHRMFRQSYVGMLYTGRRTRGGAPVSRTTLGADFLMATSQFMGSDNLSVGGFLVNAPNPAAPGKHKAFGVTVDYPNDPWASTFFYREIQEHYEAAVGFTPRRGFRRLEPTLVYTSRPQGNRLIRTIQYGADANFILSTRDNTLLNRDVDVTLVNVTTHSQDGFQAHLLPSYERLDEDFTIRPGITLAAGNTYRYTRYRFDVSTAQRRVVALSPSIEMGSFYSGTRRKLALGLNLRLRPGVIIYTTAELNHVRLDEGSFTTHLFRIVPELQFNPRVAWVNNVQYDTQSALLGWQSRFRWIVVPGDDFYLVYTHNWLDDPLQHRIYTLDRRAASKVLYTHRF